MSFNPPALLTKIRSFLTRRPPDLGPGIKVISSLMLSPKDRVYLVEIGESWLVMGSSANGLTTLAQMHKGGLPLTLHPSQAPFSLEALMSGATQSSDRKPADSAAQTVSFSGVPAALSNSQPNVAAFAAHMMAAAGAQHEPVAAQAAPEREDVAVAVAPDDSAAPKANAEAALPASADLPQPESAMPPEQPQAPVERVMSDPDEYMLGESFLDHISIGRVQHPTAIESHPEMTASSEGHKEKHDGGDEVFSALPTPPSGPVENAEQLAAKFAGIRAEASRIDAQQAVGADADGFPDPALAVAAEESADAVSTEPAPALAEETAVKPARTDAVAKVETPAAEAAEPKKGQPEVQPVAKPSYMDIYKEVKNGKA